MFNYEKTISPKTIDQAVTRLLTTGALSSIALMFSLNLPIDSPVKQGLSTLLTTLSFLGYFGACYYTGTIISALLDKHQQAK